MNSIPNKTVQQLRNEGCMVIVWTPHEIGKADFEDSRDQIVSFGNQILDAQNDEPRIGSISDWTMPGENLINGQLTI